MVRSEFGIKPSCISPYCSNVRYIEDWHSLHHSDNCAEVHCQGYCNQNGYWPSEESQHFGCVGRVGQGCIEQLLILTCTQSSSLSLGVVHMYN